MKSRVITSNRSEQDRRKENILDNKFGRAIHGTFLDTKGDTDLAQANKKYKGDEATRSMGSLLFRRGSEEEMEPL